MLGRFRFNDEPLTGDDGTFDSPVVVAIGGVLVPLLIVGFAAYVIWDGGITIHGRGMSPHRYAGFHPVAAVMCICVGSALVLFAKYFLPNVYRRSYCYQYFALAGGVLAIIGLGWFVLGALWV